MKLYLMSLSEGETVVPIGTEAKTDAEVTQALAWQVRGGFKREDYRVCFAHTFVRGVMCCRGTGKQYWMWRGALTQAAFDSMLESIWPT